MCVLESKCGWVNVCIIACVSKAHLFACLRESLRVSPSLSVRRVRVTAWVQAAVSGSVRMYVCAFDRTKQRRVEQVHGSQLSVCFHTSGQPMEGLWERTNLLVTYTHHIIHNTHAPTYKATSCHVLHSLTLTRCLLQYVSMKYNSLSWL